MPRQGLEESLLDVGSAVVISLILEGNLKI